MSEIKISRQGSIAVVSIERPARRNAVDRNTAGALAAAFRDFDEDEEIKVGVLTGSDGHFCAGADLMAMAAGTPNRLEPEGDGPMGPTRMRLSKPVIAAIEGAAVAGGLELALWCDLRVAAESATLGVLCRRWGVPLIDGGAARLPHLIGLSRALDLILTGRAVNATEAFTMGLVNRVCAPGDALPTAIAMAEQIANAPQACMKNDRASAYHALEVSHVDAMKEEFRRGMLSLADPEMREAVMKFVGGAGRHGEPS